MNKNKVWRGIKSFFQSKITQVILFSILLPFFVTCATIYFEKMVNEKDLQKQISISIEQLKESQKANEISYSDMKMNEANTLYDDYEKIVIDQNETQCLENNDTLKNNFKLLYESNVIRLKGEPDSAITSLRNISLCPIMGSEVGRQMTAGASIWIYLLVVVLMIIVTLIVLLKSNKSQQNREFRNFNKPHFFL